MDMLPGDGHVIGQGLADHFDVGFVVVLGDAALIDDPDVGLLPGEEAEFGVGDKADIKGFGGAAAGEGEVEDAAVLDGTLGGA